MARYCGLLRRFATAGGGFLVAAHLCKGNVLLACGRGRNEDDISTGFWGPPRPTLHDIILHVVCGWDFVFAIHV